VTEALFRLKNAFWAKKQAYLFVIALYLFEGIFRLQGTQVLENGFTPDGSGPGALDLFSAQLFSFRWPASNDSEAFDDAVATMVHSSLFSQSNDSQLKFKFRNDATKGGGFLLLSHTATPA
jgi:hypothetical protein